MKYVCGGCGAASEDALPLACPRAGDGGDHVLVRETPAEVAPPGPEENPFLRYRRRLPSYALAASDAAWVELVEWLDSRITAIDGHGFRRTPLVEMGAGVLVKDETGNVAGSHKARHLMGVLLHLELAGRTGELAIASCGNAALAAAVVARAADRPLSVFIPPSADPRVVERLRELGARITVCERRAGEAGDPTYLRFLEAVAGGAVPFCCQGNVCAPTIDGGRTLGYEIVEQLGERKVDRVLLQVGGGAMASAVIQAFAETGGPKPRFHVVQTEGGHPFQLAWEAIAAHDGDLAYAAGHRAEFMRPWPVEPRSVAHGILDDETYDWLEIARGLLASGGSPVVVSEVRLEEANRTAVERTGIAVDPTGSAGLAGLLELRARGLVDDAERCVVVFSGIRR